MALASRIPILMYHRVGNAHNDWERKYCVSPKRFLQHMVKLRSNGWNAIPLVNFFAWHQAEKELPEKSFLLTFDDGFLDVYEYAAPVLTMLNWPATFFLVSQLIGGRDDWCRTLNPSGETYPLMELSHIRELGGQGFSFQSHTRRHADLATLDQTQLEDELSGSRSDLQDLLGEPVDYLAYPFGRFNEQVILATQGAGYRAAFSTRPGFNRRGEDPFRLRRIDVFGTDSTNALQRKITLGSNDGRLGNMLRYRASRVLARIRG